VAESREISIHVPVLALAGEKAEFRNQALDFAAANPPGYGVNWMCAMDVAIRAANLVLAMDMLEGQGADFDDDFGTEFHALIDAHARFIAGNLEDDGPVRGNHYLADITGLLFAAAWLPRSSQTEKWVAFAVRELVDETGRQFTNDGANFEASTSYHRLSAEMVAWGSGLILGLKFATLPDWHFERLEKMAEFSRDITKPNGRIVQVGDNDSGRFFKLAAERPLDHGGLIGAVNGLFDRADFASTIDTSIVRALAGGARILGYGGNGAKNRLIEASAEEEDWWEIAETVIEPPDASVLENLTAISYPDFGLYIWRSDRFFMSLRCGPVGQNGNGGHAHNDQLAMELNIDGEDWLADPGSYLYTPSPERRDAYRSVHAHAAPKLGDGEPARLDLGLFRLEDRARARCLSFTEDAFEGVHEGYGEALYRRVLIEDGRIRVIDGVPKAQPPHQPVTVKDAGALKALWSLELPFSPGYGEIDD